MTCSDMARVSHASGRILFLLGADDESMPMVGGESCLLTDEDRALLAQFGGVETALDQDQRMDREMMLIYECCTMPSERLCLSYSAHDVDGAEKRPSFVIHRLRELFLDVERTPESGRLPSALIPALDVSSARGDRIMLADLAELTRGKTAHRALNAMDERLGKSDPSGGGGALSRHGAAVRLPDGSGEAPVIMLIF